MNDLNNTKTIKDKSLEVLSSKQFNRAYKDFFGVVLYGAVFLLPYGAYLSADSSPLASILAFFGAALIFAHILAFKLVDVKWKAKLLDYPYYIFGILGILGFLLKPGGHLDTLQSLQNEKTLLKISKMGPSFKIAEEFIKGQCRNKTRIILEEPSTVESSLNWSKDLSTNCEYLKTKLHYINSSSYDDFYTGKVHLRWKIKVPLLPKEYLSYVSEEQIKLKESLKTLSDLLELKRTYRDRSPKSSEEHKPLYKFFLELWAYILSISLAIKLAKTTREISLERK